MWTSEHRWLSFFKFGYKVSGYVESPIPVVIPKFLINPLILPAIPSLVLSTLDIIKELFGD